MELCYTNQDLCRIPGHATQAKAGLSGTWAEADRPKPRCTWQIQPRPGLHVPVFCTDLNLFYSIHFPHFFFIPLWVWLETLQHCQYTQCPLPLSIVIRMRLVIRQSKLPACLADVQLAHQNTFWHLSHSLVKMTDKMDEICINGKFSAQELSEWRDFSILVCNFTVFQPRI